MKLRIIIVQCNNSIYSTALAIQVFFFLFWTQEIVTRVERIPNPTVDTKKRKNNLKNIKQTNRYAENKEQKKNTKLTKRELNQKT